MYFQVHNKKKNCSFSFYDNKQPKKNANEWKIQSKKIKKKYNVQMIPHIYEMYEA